MTKTTTARAIIETLKANGIDTVFGLPGVQLDEMFSALYNAKSDIRLIHPRHEQSTAYMASGYAQSTGRVGTCLVVPGPGVLNASAALATAYANNTPVLCLTGQILSSFIGKGYGTLHEIADQPGAMKSVTKWQGRIAAPEDTSQVLAQAFEQLNNGRRRPVLVETPPDILAKEGDFAIAEPSAAAAAEINFDLIEQAAYLLNNAANPAILVGGGAMDASAEITQLAEMLQAPVIMSQNGLGVVDYRNPLGQHMVAGAEYWPQVDVALAIGTRFTMPMLDWGYDDDIKLIRIDVDPNQPVKPWTPDVHIVSDAGDAVQQLNELVTANANSRSGEFADLKATADKRIAGALAPQHAWNSAIRDVLPDDGFACFDLTQMGYHSWYGFPTYNSRAMIQQGYQGTLGYSFPTALGAKVANPDKQVICVTGDGGFMFTMPELATAVQEKINLVTIVFNDGGYGNVRRLQKLYYDESYIACDLHAPDFVKLAELFGMMGRRAKSPAELRGILDEAFSADAPVLIEVPVGEMPFYRNVAPRRKLRGA